MREKIDSQYDHMRRMKELRLQNADTPSWSDEEDRVLEKGPVSDAVTVNQETQSVFVT